MRIHQIILASILGFGFTFATQEADAIGNFKPRPGELALLPSYCAPRAEGWGDDIKRPEVAPWAQIYGKDWFHMHHLCNALNYINRSARNYDQKTRNLSLALIDLGYMERNANSPQALAETQMANAVALLGLKREVEAFVALNKAVSLAPETATTHIRLVDYYISRKQTAQALVAVTEGLRHVPESKSLQRRYTELGGKPPFPTPYEKAETEPLNTMSEKSISPESAPSKEKPVSEPSQQDEGNRDKPWCRFCP